MVYLPHWPIPSTIGGKKINYETVFERMSLVLSKLHDPHLKLSPIIHITGTNGKGSTAKLIAQILCNAGYKTNLYTSPHLINCNERILLGQNKSLLQIDDGFLYEIMEEVRLASQGIDLTFMESFTIGAILAFSKTQSDISVIEVGMGGRIDATNIIQNKIATVVTPISLDHMEYLGDNIIKIALEKVMIFKPDVPMILSPQTKEVELLISSIAKDKKFDCFLYGKDYEISFLEENSSNNNFVIEFFNKKLANDRDFIIVPKPNLDGNHQFFNFATAITTINAIAKYFPVKDCDIFNAVKNLNWKSRIENITNQLLKFFDNKNNQIWIDGAHNIAGAFVLSEWIKNFNDNFLNIIICGFSRNKCKLEFLQHINKNANLIIAVRVEGEPFPENSTTIASIGQLSNINIIDKKNLEDAFIFLNKNFLNKNLRIVICGSFHLARDVEFLSKL